MKKLLFILLLFSIIIGKAQVGLILTGQSFTNTSDSITISTLYVIPAFIFDGSTNTTVRLSPCISKYKAVTQQQLIGNNFNMPYYGFQIAGATYPTRAVIFNQSISYLQGQGFTVTTF